MEFRRARLFLKYFILYKYPYSVVWTIIWIRRALHGVRKTFVGARPAATFRYDYAAAASRTTHTTDAATRISIGRRRRRARRGGTLTRTRATPPTERARTHGHARTATARRQLPRRGSVQRSYDVLVSPSSSSCFVPEVDHRTRSRTLRTKRRVFPHHVPTPGRGPSGGQTLCQRTA